MLFAHPARAQTVMGRVVESGTSVSVPSALVTLVDSAFTRVFETFTNSSGAFLLQAPGPGSYYVLVEALGYHPAIDGILDMGDGGSITVDFHIRPRPLPVDSLLVSVRRAISHRVLRATGYYERQAQGFGHFVTPELLEDTNPRDFGDILWRIPGLWVVNADGGTQLSMRGGNGSPCRPPVYLDGARVNPGLGGLESVVDIDQIAAVEAYTRASATPLQYGGTGAGCGAVLIWTK